MDTEAPRSYREENLTFSYKIDQRPDPAKREFELHIHDYYELFCFLAGHAEYVVEGNVYPLTPGSILLMRPGELHRVRILSEHPYKRCVFQFSPDILPDDRLRTTLLRPYDQRPLGKQNLYTPDAFSQPLAAEIIPSLTHSGLNGDMGRAKVLCHLMLMMTCIADVFEARGEEGVAGSAIEPIIIYINTHLSEDLGIPQLCAKFYLSESHINRLFRQYTRLSVGQYIQAKRLHRARSLLTDGYKAGEVCQMCGYRDYSAFYRAYRKTFGVTPGAKDG